MPALPCPCHWGQFSSVAPTRGRASSSAPMPQCLVLPEAEILFCPGKGQSQLSSTHTTRANSTKPMSLLVPTCGDWCIVEPAQCDLWTLRRLQVQYRPRYLQSLLQWQCRPRTSTQIPYALGKHKTQGPGSQREPSLHCGLMWLCRALKSGCFSVLQLLQVQLSSQNSDFLLSLSLTSLYDICVCFLLSLFSTAYSLATAAPSQERSNSSIFLCKEYLFIDFY